MNRLPAQRHTCAANMVQSIGDGLTPRYFFSSSPTGQ